MVATPKLMRCLKCGGTLALVDHGEVQQEYPKSYERWTREEDKLLAGMCEEGKGLLEMVNALDRAPTAVKRRIETLGMVVRKRKEIQVGDVERAVRAGINHALKLTAGIEWGKKEEEMVSSVRKGVETLGQAMEKEGGPDR